MLLRGILLQTYLVIVASFILATVESQTISVYSPSVAAELYRRSVVLRCNVTGLPANNYMEWIYYPTWHPSGITIYSTYDGINNDPTNFTVRPMTTAVNTLTFDLVINTAKPELATQYVCNLMPIPGYGKSVNFIVLVPMDCPTIIDEYDEGIETNRSCTFGYYDATQTYTPRITWKRDGQEVPGVVHISESLTRKTAILTKNVTSADDGQKFVCVVDFLDSNPDYTDNCTTDYHVMHVVSQISFYPPYSAEAPTSVAVGDVIECITNGRPVPTIEWYDGHWNLVSGSGWRKLAVTTDMRFWRQPITLRINARNKIHNGVKSKCGLVYASYTFNVVDAAPIVWCGGIEAWVIAVAVIVPIVVLAAIAIAVFFIIRHCRMKEKYTKKTTKGGSASTPLLS